ncbi:hypothetical protein AVEN_238860-1 [Araneus ventricosus]|uniref:Uncharacterized protein n=1 Tax=Araneus ventricosus TaxID=182803 RepID=A0A4Y2EKR6_ARAVE|nr:hypothetical protein AVEN_238860-1 [Araneus ventricosus]
MLHHVPHSPNKVQVRNICKNMLQICSCGSTSCHFCISHCSPNLANKNPGKWSHARWITTANRLLRLYKSTREPFEKFKEIARFIIKDYAPMWFYIKCNPSIMKAPVHLHRTIVLEAYVDLMIWQQCVVTEPPLTRHLSEGDLRACIEESSTLLALICDFPCHTEAEERCVKASLVAMEVLPEMATSEQEL